ncbi:Rab11/RabA-family small GTPase [Suillus subluteus]|nr:Rab11/RabA-family small GTPase [Suillus subluteus]
MMQYYHPQRPPWAFDEQYDYSCKLVLIGDSGVGKSNLLLQLVQNKFTETPDCHLGLDHKILMVINPDGLFQWVKSNIYDTAGLERSDAISPYYYYDAAGALLVYDITNVASYQSVTRWLKELRDHGKPNIVIMLVRNKTDKDYLRMVRTVDAKTFAAKNNLLFCEASAREHSNVVEAFCSVINEIHRIKSGAGARQPDTRCALIDGRFISLTGIYAYVLYIQSGKNGTEGPSKTYNVVLRSPII